MKNGPTRYREIVVTGSPLEMGRQIGEYAREEIRGFAEIALQRVNKSVAVSPERASRAAHACIDLVRQYSPDMLDELQGMADGSGLKLEQLMLLQIRNQFTVAEDAGCTSFAAATSYCAESGALVGQNWDNDSALDPFTIVLTRRPVGKPALMNLTQAGLIAYVGLNDAGIGLCLNSLPAPSRELGVPHYFTVRGIYESTSLDEAVEAVNRASRAIPANVMMATPQGPADLEVTIDSVHVLRDEGTGLLTHTNHCLHPDLLPINDQFPELIQSHPRKQRIDELLADKDEPLYLHQFKAALADHQDQPISICRHANDDPQNGYWTTVFSIIIDVENRIMHVSRGTPCQAQYEPYQLF